MSPLNAAPATAATINCSEITNDNQIKDQGNSVAAVIAALSSQCNSRRIAAAAAGKAVVGSRPVWCGMQYMFLVIPLGSGPKNNLQICMR